MNRPQTIREQAERLFALLGHAARFYRMGIVLCGVGLVISLGLAVTRPRIYRSEALILYSEHIATNALGREEAGESARRIGMRLHELVLSRSRLTEVINRFKLYQPEVEDRGMAEAVDLMRTKVQFKAREGDTYALSFEGEDQDVVQAVTKALTDDLVAENERRSKDVARDTKEFLEGESKHIEDELKKREAILAKFLSDHPAFAAEAARSGAPTMVSMSGKAPAGAGPSRRRSSDPRVEALEREAERIQARLNPTPPTAPSLPPEAKEAAEEWGRRKSDATRELEAAQRELADRRQSLTDEHPDVKRAKARVDAAVRLLDEVQVKGVREQARVQGKTAPPIQPLTQEDKDQLHADLSRIQEEIARSRAVARRSEADKGASDKGAVSEADTIVKLETTYAQITREVNEAREQRNQVEDRLFMANLKASVMQNEGSARMMVIDAPYRPTRPVRGGRTQTLALGGAVSLLLALLVMLGRALVDDRVYHGYDIERLELGPLLTVVPPVAGGNQRDRKRPAAPGQRQVAHG